MLVGYMRVSSDSAILAGLVLGWWNFPGFRLTSPIKY